MTTTTNFLRWLAAASCLLAGANAHAAGGHHAVDDATIADPGQCQVEVWFERERGGNRTLRHVGPACRVGDFELGLSLDGNHSFAAGNTLGAAPQVKWVTKLTESVMVGAALSFNWQHRSGSGSRYASTAVLLPLTWQATPSLQVHANLGRDIRRGSKDEKLAGLAGEWTAGAGWSFVAERFRDGTGHNWRAGARWEYSPAFNIGLSQARPVNASVPGAPRPWWTLGATWTFER